jgi:hypothetical protein
MALMFGTERPDGRVQITEIQYQRDSDPRGGHAVDARDIPEYPQPRPGIGHTMLFDPATREFSFEEHPRPYSTEEAILEVAAALREIAAALRGA